jgi:hypothetical protein
MFFADIRGYCANLDALRDFVEVLQPMLATNEVTTLKENRQLVLALMYAMQQADPTRFPSISLPESQKQALRKRVRVTGTPGKGNATVLINANGLGAGNVEKFFRALRDWGKGEARSRLLFNSSLISLVSSVEWFFSRVLHAYFRKYPQAAVSTEKTFSFDDLTHFGTIDEARQYLIERRVEDILRGSFSDWIKYFRNSIKLTMTYLDPCMDMLVETCERRNLLVHNNGVTNNIYLSKVSPKLTTGLKPGTQIPVERAYLDQRITFERCCVLLAAELWKQLEPSEERRGSVLIDLAFEHMKQQRWTIVEGFSYFLMNDKKLPERHTMVGKMNFWLSLKRQSRWDEVKDQVAAEDMSARDRIFQLAWFSLCEKRDDFFDLLPSAIKARDMDLERLESFPIFDEIKSDARYKTTVERIKKRSERKRVRRAPLREQTGSDGAEPKQR